MGEMQGRIAQKWGFGMAPPKPDALNERQAACVAFLDVLGSEDLPAANDELLSAISTVKGLFNRVVREDQWDWFTVAAPPSAAPKPSHGAVMPAAMASGESNRWLSKGPRLR